jgi:hypothetical protein
MLRDFSVTIGRAGATRLKIYIFIFQPDTEPKLEDPQSTIITLSPFNIILVQHHHSAFYHSVSELKTL